MHMCNFCCTFVGVLIIIKDMEIEKALNGTELTLKIIGRLDTVTAPELEACLKESLDGVANLVMDFAALDYISSAGLRVILQADRKSVV